MTLISARISSTIRFGFLNQPTFTRSMSMTKLARPGPRTTAVIEREGILAPNHHSIFNQNQALSMMSLNLYRRMSSTSVPEIVVKVENNIRSITIDRQPKKNAINGAMYIALSDAIRSADEDVSTKIVVLTGKGEYYTSGNDVKNFSGRDYTFFIHALIDCKKPVIALVNGPVIGIGVTSLGLVDGVYCSDKATFLTPFSRINVCAEGCSSYTFPLIMGYAKASELLSFNAKITSQQALDWGLVGEIFPDAVFQEKAWARVNEIAQLPIKSLMYSKELVRGRDREFLHTLNEKEADMLFECIKEAYEMK